MDVKGDRNVFSINLSYDESVWSGTSEDIPGLFLEADTIEELIIETKEIAPYLIEENLKITQGEIRLIPDDLNQFFSGIIQSIEKQIEKSNTSQSFKTTYYSQENMTSAVAIV